MKYVVFNLRCTVKEWRLLKAGAAESGMSLNKFCLGSAKLLAVLGLHKEQQELVAATLADRMGLLIERMGDEVRKRKVKKAA